MSRGLAILGVGILVLVGGAASLGAVAGTPKKGVSVRVVGRVGVRRNVHVSFSTWGGR
jgi:hypothetical protein